MYLQVISDLEKNDQYLLVSTFSYYINSYTYFPRFHKKEEEREELVELLIQKRVNKILKQVFP